MTHRVVIVTGAGTGLGLETALHLASRGHLVYATIVEESQRAHLEQVATSRKLHLRVVLLDVTEVSSIEQAIAEVLGEQGRIDVLVNNAGISLRGYFEDLDDDEIRRTIDVNLFGVMAVTRAVLPFMRASGSGHLVFISSIGGRIASMARTAYCASKFAVEGFAESLMQEVKPLGIQVSIVEPAVIRTERWTVNRGIGRRAQATESPYAHWFQAQEKLADMLVRTSPTRPGDLARTVCEIVASKNPRLRYIVGRRAALVVRLRRYLPGELFERLYFGAAIRRVTRSR